MERQPMRQLQIIWEHIPSPISIPMEARKRLTELLGDLFSAYWINHLEGNSILLREDGNDE